MLQRQSRKRMSIKQLLKLRLMQLKPPRKKRIWKKKESLLKNSNFQKLQQLKLRPLPFLLNKRRKEKEFYLSKK